MAGISTHNVFGLTIRESATDGSDFTNPGADYRRLFLGEDGLLHLKDSAGTVTTPHAGSGAVTASGITMATARLLGRTTAATGAIEEITVGAGLALAAGALTATGGIGTDYASASTNAGQSIITGAAVAIVDFEDVAFDPGSDITTGAAWHYTAPTTGIYRVSAKVMFASSTSWSAATERGLMQLFKDGSLYRTLDRKDGWITAGAGINVVLQGVTLVSLTAGDTIDVRVAQNNGSNTALETAADSNFIDIERIG